MARDKRSKVVSKYRDLIKSGELPCWSPLPGTKVMAEEEGVSENTIRGVLQELASEGLIHRAPASYPTVQHESYWE